MFWKNNNASGKERVANTYFSTPSDSRLAFRVYPSEGDPLYLKVTGKKLRVYDISSTGIAFECSGFKDGTIHPIQLSLPENPTTIFGIIEIINTDIIEGKNICRSKLYDLTTEQEDKIHHYVLERQKEELENKKPAKKE